MWAGKARVGEARAGEVRAGETRVGEARAGKMMLCAMRFAKAERGQSWVRKARGAEGRRERILLLNHNFQL